MPPSSPEIVTLAAWAGTLTAAAAPIEIIAIASRVFILTSFYCEVRCGELTRRVASSIT
jgi:hypothetical protein